QQLATGLAGGGRGGPVAGFGGRGGPDPAGPTDYAPPYYPGVVNPSEAGKLTVAPGQEVGGIDFQIQLVALAKGTGLAAVAPEIPTVMLVPQQASGGLGRFGGQTFNGRSSADGTFMIANVPP